ncbi:hypothetical protein LQZ19_05175 [Treponema primitia]|uniref:hypothetical protein n=1 Tax=Treponema primitia TaxID=88058 RepID=UPI00397EBA86
MIYTDEFIPSLEFWPEKDVLSAFQEADQAIGTDGEALALRVFFARMYDKASETKSWADEEDIFKMAALGEALDNDRFLRSIGAEGITWASRV